MTSSRRVTLLVIIISVGFMCVCVLWWLLPFSEVVKFVPYHEEYDIIPKPHGPYNTTTVEPKPIPKPRSNFKEFLDFKEFQNMLETSLPLDCHPGPKGLLRQKYYGTFLRTLLEYTNYHHRTRNTRNSTLTWQCPVNAGCGGLGDRIRGIVTTLLLAIFSRRRFLLFWDDQSGEYLLPNMIDWSYDQARAHAQRQQNKNGTDNCISSTSDPCFFTLEANNLAIIASNVSDIVLSTNQVPHFLRSHNQEWIKTGLRSSGLAQIPFVEMNELMGVVFRYLFTIDQRLQNKTELAMDTLGLRSSPYIALHLRTGFARMSEKEEFATNMEKSISKWQAAFDCAVGIADSHLGNGSAVYLATDSNAAKDMAFSKYKQQIHMLRNPLIHVYKHVVKKPHIPDSTEREGVLTVWVEMLLLAQADMLVSSEKSGFSWTAGLLCGLHRHENTTVSTDHCK